MAVRILLLADTHLGFDLPLSPRLTRRRRGHDFLESLRRALEPARSGQVDLVIHAGDVFHRARPHHTLVAQAFQPLKAVADAGIPVVVVPGNHERSRIPHLRFAEHPLIRIFHRPETFLFDVDGAQVALLGFPYERQVVRKRFPGLVAATGWDGRAADISLLCAHHAFEGATVGPADFTFRRGPDVVRGRDIPRGLTAVLSGHIHRHQVLTHDLDHRLLPAPVIYPGSTERTAFAEMGETKGTVILEVDPGPASGAPDLRWQFQPLATRPMVEASVRADGLSAKALDQRVRAVVGSAPSDAVLRIRIQGTVTATARRVLTAAHLREMAPEEMNVELALDDKPRWVRARHSRGGAPHDPTSGGGAQRSLFSAERGVF